MGSEERRVARRRFLEAKAKAIKAARAQGCTCDVEVHPAKAEHPLRDLTSLPGLQRVMPVTVEHDDWCPLLRVMEERPPGIARTQGVLYRSEAE